MQCHGHALEMDASKEDRHFVGNMCTVFQNVETSLTSEEFAQRLGVVAAMFFCTTLDQVVAGKGSGWE